MCVCMVCVYLCVCGDNFICICIYVYIFVYIYTRQSEFMENKRKLERLKWRRIGGSVDG